MINPQSAKRKRNHKMNFEVPDQVVPDSEPGVSGRSHDNDNEMPTLCRKEFLKLQRKTGIQFGLDGGAINSTHANVSKHYQVAEFLEKDISGMHVYISPPFSSIEAVLKHYKTCKTKDPGNTSICILVPGWQSDNGGNL